ncbi:MAG: VPLPA-CTERM sorting domain-containing protein [Gammaproteobacteria bacterium]
MTNFLKGTLATAGLFAFALPAMADTVTISDTLDGSEPTFDHPVSGATTLTSYDTISFTVDADGMYDFLSFYPGDTDADENMDGVLLIYDGFDPLDPSTGLLASDDDYSAGDVAGLGAFDGACVGSNCSGFSAMLTAGTTYTLVQTSFTDVANTFGQPTGSYDLTLTGAGNITVVPVPAAVWLMMSGLAGLGFMRRK